MYQIYERLNVFDREAMVDVQDILRLVGVVPSFESRFTLNSHRCFSMAGRSVSPNGIFDKDASIFV